MNRLIKGVSSQYIEAANRLRPKDNRVRIVAYVESYNDVAFWRLLLDEFESDRVTFNIMLPTNEKLLLGKKSALSRCLDSSMLGQNMIACVDSDYDYLMQGATYASREFIDSPYVIQTYTYAIENYQCYSGSLNQVCVQCTLNDRRPIDFEAFFELYSKIVFPLFAWNIWFYRNRKQSEFSMKDFNICIQLDTVDLNSPQDSLMLLETKVSKKIAWLERTRPEAVRQVESLKSELPSLGVHPEDTYLYIQGHFLFERVLTRLMDPVLTDLRREREYEISRLSVHSQQRENELSSYRHSQISLAQALRENTHYRDSSPYQRMRNSVKELLKRNGLETD